MSMLGTSYKTAWYMLMRIRAAMGRRDKTHRLQGTIEFDDTCFGGPTVGKKRGRGAEKAKVFVAVSLEERRNPLYAKMRVCSTGCTSRSATPRRSSWVLTMACPKSTSKPTLTNIASASAAVTLANAFWNAWSKKLYQYPQHPAFRPR